MGIAPLFLKNRLVRDPATANDGHESRLSTNPLGTTHQKQSRPRSALTSLLALAILFGFGWFAWQHYSTFAWSRFFQAFGLINRYWFIAGVLAAFASFTVRAVRWQALMLPARSSFRSVWQATFIGCSACVILGRAGELVRPFLIARRERTEFSLQAGIWVLERLYDFLVILALFGIGISRARKLGVSPDSPLESILRIGGWIVFAGAALTAGFLILVGPHAESLQRRLAHFLSFLPPARVQTIIRVLNSFLSGARIGGGTFTVLLTIAWSAVEWLLILAAYWCYFQAFPPTEDIALLDVAGFLGFIGLGGIIQLPGIGGGMQMASLIVLTALFRLPVEAATGFTLLIWVGTTLVVLPFGIPLVLIQGLNLKQISTLRDQNTL
ncbi:MAG TPA: lysylphosphatidylglycerol synthase transmembrane domain-containing protein [Bryobacteraceae bacterium]|jgi:hypothetical protein|nr:lysylphosphatidylglycerol synthase transmembrane domain-containing protein [Bryobacteraceae bacterium]